MSSSSGIRGKAKGITWLCTLVYFGSYITRINFAVLLINILSDLNYEKTELSVVITGLTISYGIGQVICGFLGDKIKPRYMLMGGLLLAAICNACMALPFVTGIPMMTVIWSINGFAQAMLWPPIVRIMSTYLTDDEYGYASVRVSWGSQFATALLYLICPLLLKALSWRIIILLCALVSFSIDVIWTFSSKKLLSEPLNVIEVKDKTEKKKGSPLPIFVFFPLACIILGIISQGSMRDGVTNWMPSLLLESFGLSEDKAIIATVILAIFAIFSFYIFDLIHRKLFKNEVFCAAMIFAFSFVMTSGLYALNIFNMSSVVSSMLLMAIIVANMHGINLMLITVVPKRFFKSGKVATFSGILNACTYIGSAVGTYVFAKIAEISNNNWTPVILAWAIISVVGAVVCFAATPLWKKFCKQYAEK